MFAVQRAMLESTRDMKLYWSSRSPFVRKVMVAAHEVGIADRIRTQRVVVAPNNPNIEVMQDNPLSKIPTLVFDDGTSLYDSRVICEYFDTLHDGPKLFPANPDLRWKALRRQALGDGLMEVIVLRLGEMSRPREAQSDPHLVGRDLLDPAHHPEAFLTVDQRHIVGRALRRMHNGRSVDGPDPCADAPFQPVAAGEGTQHAGEKHRSPRREAELIGELAALEMIEVDPERRLNVCRHGLLPVFTSQFQLS